MQSDLVVPDRAFALVDWGDGFWEGDYIPPIPLMSDDTSTGTESVTPPRGERPLPPPLVFYTHVGKVVRLSGVDVDFSSLEVEYRGQVVTECWQGHKLWRKFGTTSIRMNCDVHHLVGRPPVQWRSDPRRYVTLRYLTAGGIREIRLHIHSKGAKEYDTIIKH